MKSKVLGESSSSSEGNGNWTSYVVTVWAKGQDSKSRVFCMATIEGQVLITTLPRVQDIRMALVFKQSFPRNNEFLEYYAHIQHINDDRLTENIPIQQATFVDDQEIILELKRIPHYKHLAVLIVSH